MAAVWPPDVDENAEQVGQEELESWLAHMEEYDTHTRLKNVNMAGRVFEKRDWHGCAFEGSRLFGISAQKNHFSNVVFKNCDLSSADLSECVFSRVLFSGCKLAGTAMYASGFNNVTFRGCVAESISFTDASLNTVLFEESRFTAARMDSMTGKGYRFVNCDLQGATLFGTLLKGQDLTSCEISGAALTQKEVNGAVVNSMQAVGLAKLLGIIVRD